MKPYPKDQDRVIDWFANAIRSKIADKSHKGDWKDLTMGQMFEYAKGEMDELELAIIGGNPVEILLEAADVAACVMMVADISNGCPRPDEVTKLRLLVKSLQAQIDMATGKSSWGGRSVEGADRGGDVMMGGGTTYDAPGTRWQTCGGCPTKDDCHALRVCNQRREDM